MADVKFRTVRNLIRTTVGTEDFTISGFGTPSAAIFISTNATVNNTQQANSEIGIGFTDGTRNQAAGIQIEDNLGTTDTNRWTSNTKCMGVVDSASTVLYEADFNSFITDGVRVDVTTAPGTATYVTCILIGGSDVTNAYTNLFSFSADTTPTDVTDPGFEPDLVLFTGMGQSTDSGFAGHAINNFGVAHNGGNQKGVTFSVKDNAASVETTSSSRDADINGQAFDGSQQWFGTISGFDASGFTATPNVAPGSDRVYYLALKFSNSPDVAVISQDGPTSTGDKAYTEPGFEPDFGFLALSSNTAVNTIETTGEDGYGFSVFDATNSFSNTISAQDTSDPSNANTISADKAIHTLSGGSSDSHVGTLSSFDATGWTMNFTTVPGAATKWAGFAIGVGAAAPVLSLPTPSGTLGTQTTATLGATTDTTSGTFYGVVDSAANISGITASQIIAGDNTNDVAAVASSNSAVSTTTPSTGVTGLTAATLYSYAVTQSGGSNVLTGTFTTAAASPIPVITSVNGGSNIVTGTVFDYVGTDFEAVKGIGDATEESISLSTSVWGDLLVTATALVVESGVTKYGPQDLGITNNSGNSDTISANVVPGTNKNFTDLVAPLATSGLRITAIPDLIGDDQLRFGTVVFESDQTTPTTYTVAVQADGSYIVSGGPFVDGDYAFLVNSWDSTDGSTPWGTEVWQTFTISMDESGNGIITNIVQEIIGDITGNIVN